MTKQEIGEIKKLYKLNNCGITRICGCYVDGEKNIKDRWAQPFMAMDEEDILKYLEVFKKCFSGGLEKNLINTKVPDIDTQAELLAIRNSKLKDEHMLDELYLRIIDTYEYVGNYLILVIHDVYDVPGKTKDGIEMEDASEEVYEYILACICPVKLSKPGLGYDKDKNVFTHMERDWLLMPPELAVLYPAFNDRSEDRDSALVYARNLKQEDKEFLERFMGCDIRLSHTEERDTFEAILEDLLGAADINEVKAVQEKVRELAQEHELDPEPMKLDKAEMEKLFYDSGISEAKMRRFEEVYFGNMGNKTEITLNNIVNMRSFDIDTGIGKIRIKPDYADEITIQEVDGRMCLVMNIIGDVTVNGIRVRTMEEEQ